MAGVGGDGGGAPFARCVGPGVYAVAVTVAAAEGVPAADDAVAGKIVAAGAAGF